MSKLNTTMYSGHYSYFVLGNNLAISLSKLLSCIDCATAYSKNII